MNLSYGIGQERELIQEAREDLSAFQNLYSHYLPRIYAYVAYRIGRTQDVEDLVSSVFLRALENIGAFEWRGDGSFAAWLFRSAYHAVVDYSRERGKENDIIPLDDLPGLTSSLMSPPDFVQRKEGFAYLSALIAHLPPRRQEVITLKFFGDLRNKEIAEILDLDEHTVASNLYRGLEDLHHLYLQDLGDQQQQASEPRNEGVSDG